MYKRLVILFLICPILSNIFCPDLVFAKEKLKVGIIDTEVDLTHRQIVPFIDEELLRSMHIWVDQLKKKSGKANLISENESSAKEASGASHGTLVALNLLNGLDPEQVTLVPIPLISGSNNNLGLFQFASLIFNLSFRKNKLLQAFHEHIDYISRLIKENNLSVVNISLGVGTRKKLPLKLSSLVMSLHKSLFDRVIATNPNTTFILAAGNDGLRMRNEGLNIAKNENVIYVGATSFLSYKASDYSNYSKTMVDVLADGNNIREELSWGTSFSAPTLGNTFIRFQLFNPDLTRDDVHRNFLQYSLIEVDDNSDYAIKGRTLIDGPYRKDTASLYLSNFTLHDIPSGYEVYVKPMASLAEVLKNEWDIEEYHKHRERGFMVGYSVDNSQVWALVKEDVVTPISPGSEFLALELKKLLLLPRLNKSCSTLLEGSVRISEPG